VNGTTIYAFLFGATFLASFASGLAGFAYALIAAGVFLQFLPPPEAAALVIAGSIAAQTMTVFRLGAAMSWPRLWPFLLGGVVGVPLGVLVLSSVDSESFRFGMGVFLIAYSIFVLVRRRPLTVSWGGRIADGTAGMIGGVMAGLAGLSGAIPTIWCTMRGWPKDEQRGVFQPFILIIQCVALLALGGAGVITKQVGLAFVICLPAVVIGTWLGHKLYRRIDDQQFRRIVLLLLLMSGVALVVH
jgi:uncharacterized protein